MARVFKRSGFYWIDFLDADGRRHRRKGGPTKRVATEVLNDVLAKVARQEHLGVLDSNIAFPEYATAWLERTKPKVKPRTHEAYSLVVKRHLAPAFSGTLKSLGVAQVERYVAERLRNGAEPATINLSLAVLRAICRSAVRDKHLGKYPLEGLRPLRTPPGRVRFLSPEEVEGLLAACESASADSRMPGAYLKPFALLALNTGMRRNEIAYLTRRQVDWSARIASLTDTKSGEARQVPLNAAAIAALRSVPPRIDTDRFFPFSPLDVTREFAAAVKRAGIPDFRLHDCRHTFASYQAMSGSSPRVLQDLLGHRDGRMTTRYSHLSDAFLRAAVDRVQLGFDGPPDAKVAPIWHHVSAGEGNLERDQEDAPAQNRTGT